MKFTRFTTLLVIAALIAAMFVGTFNRPARAEELWQTDFKAALAKAKAEKKYLLLDFTGSDWCFWCKKLRTEVFDQEPFKAEAAKQYVLVEIDFPQQKKLPDDLQKQNEELKDKYGIEGFPTVLMLDGDGQLIARTGYAAGGPEKYIKQLAEFPKVFAAVAAAKAKLADAKGIDRAKLLDRIIEGYGKLGNESEEQAKQTDEWGKEIIALDPDNTAGLKVKYEFPMKMDEATKLARSGKFDQAINLIDKALEAKDLPGDLRQQGYMTKAEAYEPQGKFADVVESLKAAKAAAPQSEEAAQIEALLKQFTKLAEAQRIVAKLEAELPNTQGLDRAKLLDKLITTSSKEKLPMTRDTAAKLQKWSNEIIQLDAENKAGLKPKYEFRMAVTGAMELANASKLPEAAAALDKALQTPGADPEDLQQGCFMRAKLCQMQNDSAGYLSFLKKALDAAPNSDFAPGIRQMIEQVEPSAKSQGNSGSYSKHGSGTLEPRPEK